MDNEEADFGSGEVQQDSKGGAIGGGGGDHAIALNLKKKVSESLNGSCSGPWAGAKEVLRRQSRTVTAESGQRSQGRL